MIGEFRQSHREVGMAVQVSEGDKIALVIGLMLLLVVLAASAQYFATGQ